MTDRYEYDDVDGAPGAETATEGGADQEATGDTQPGPEDAGSGPESRRGRVAGAFNSLKDAISEARERGDLSAEKAREVFMDAADRARSATSEARERFDFVTQGEFDALLERVARLEAHLGVSGDEGAPGPDGGADADGEG